MLTCPLYLQIRVSFVNELGVEEAGIDGGGIFKDFMENITRAAFDVQYGLFKVWFFIAMNFSRSFVFSAYAQFPIMILCMIEIVDA